MDYFVNIRPVFSEQTNRKIEDLSKLYHDKDYLFQLITNTIDPYLHNEIIANKRILLKPNWVLHNLKETDEICMRTDDNFLLVALEIVLRKKPKSVLIGDAPVQNCLWEQTIREKFRNEVDFLSKKYKIPVKIKDFRRVTFSPELNNPVRERNPLEDYIIFDLGKKSFLEPISYDTRKLFRVTNYDPDRLAESHGPGVHKYCITKELFDSDVVITIPKVKTHQKTGITNALKILVGVNGDKDFLPHHRKGGTGSGGDCYPGNNILRKLSETFLDQANRKQGKTQYKYWKFLSSYLWRFSYPNNEQNLAAAWYGNDTTWRMVLDLNKIAEFGKADGQIAETPQRVIYSLSDGIIGGQGNGPLNPDPLALGVISFSNSSVMTDILMAKLMNFDIEKIPLLKNAQQLLHNSEKKIYLNNEQVELEEVSNYSIKCTPPPGWLNHLV